MAKQIKELETALDKDGLTITEAERRNKERDIQNIKTEFQRKQRELREDINLRKNGSTPSAGAGLGFDRLVRICTGIENIRDVVPFPVAYQECGF